MDTEQVANTLIVHILEMEEKFTNDQELGKETRRFIESFKEIKKEHDAHDAEVKRLIDEN